MIDNFGDMIALSIGLLIGLLGLVYGCRLALWPESVSPQSWLYRYIERLFTTYGGKQTINPSQIRIYGFFLLVLSIASIAVMLIPF
jgi:hypothetical protein